MNRKERRRQQARAQKAKAAQPNVILTPESPRCNEFADALFEVVYQPPYCDGDRIQAGEDKVHRHAKHIMANMGGIDIAGSLAFFADQGGHCDCEILLNVDPDRLTVPNCKLQGAATMTKQTMTVSDLIETLDQGPSEDSWKVANEMLPPILETAAAYYDHFDGLEPAFTG